MKTKSLFVRVYGERTDDQWSLICLDFSLAAQAPSLPEAKLLLQSQIKEYVIEALVGQDNEHAFHLMSRRAPAKYWFKWYYAVLRKHLHSKLYNVKAICQPLPLVPA